MARKSLKVDENAHRILTEKWRRICEGDGIGSPSISEVIRHINRKL